MKFIIYEKSRKEFQVAWSGKPLIVGRRSDADIQVNEPTMSGTHAQIFGDNGAVRIRDLESLNGTYVNGRRVSEVGLQPGDEIRIGRVMIVVAGPARFAEGAHPATERMSQPAVTLASQDESSFGSSGLKSATPIAQRIGDTRISGSSSGGGPVGSPREALFGTGGSPQHINTQTIKVSLEELSSEQLDEDDHILLLRNLFETLESATDRADVLVKVCDVLKRAFRPARVFMLERGEDGEWKDATSDARVDRPSRTFVEEAAGSTSAILSSSLPDDQRFSRSESVRISGIETAMAVPTRCETCERIVLYVDRLGLPPFERRDLNVLGIAANHVSAVLENVARFEELRRTNAELLEARESLAELNRNLEGLVDERTMEIQRQNDEISNLAEAKDELLGIAAHDIRGPLTVIQGTTELLRMRVGEIDDETLTRSLDLIHGACRGLTQLLSELLDAKAIESGKITLRKLRYPVRQLIDDSLPVARLAAEDKNVDLVVEAGDDLAIDADPQRLVQAVTNLVLNAVKFSPSGTRILLRGVARDAGRCHIEVEDQGIGIPEEEIEKIFGTFEQGSAGHQFGGSGLGLMIARRIVELHGGTLAVKSKVGVGTRFTLSLPCARALEEELQEHNAQQA